MLKLKHTGIVVAAVLGLGALGYVAYNAYRAPAAAPGMPAGGAAGPKSAAPAGVPAMAVETAQVKTSDLVDEAQAVGTLKSNESVVLRAEVAGKVASIGFADGTAVGKGSPLVALDAAVQEAELAQAKANWALAEANFKRSQDLFGKKFISQQSLDNAAATLKVQQSLVQLAEAKLAKTRVKAPFAGVVGIRNISVGDYVKEGQDLINIEDVKTLKVDFRLPEVLLDRLRRGQQIEVNSDALPGAGFKAQIDAIDPLVDANGRAISVRARLDNGGAKLRPGMFVRVRVSFGERKNALVIPEQALVTGTKPMVFTVVDGKAKMVPVKLGARRVGLVEIVEGVQDGDVVVTAGQMKLRDGVPVRAVGEGAAQPAAQPAAPAQAQPAPAAAPAPAASSAQAQGAK